VIADRTAYDVSRTVYWRTIKPVFRLQVDERLVLTIRQRAEFMNTPTLNPLELV